MSLELKNVNGNYAEIYEKDTGAMIASWNFSNPPKLEIESHAKVSTQKIIKLKEAGFESAEIIKILKELDVE